MEIVQFGVMSPNLATLVVVASPGHPHTTTAIGLTGPHSTDHPSHCQPSPTPRRNFYRSTEVGVRGVEEIASAIPKRMVLFHVSAKSWISVQVKSILFIYSFIYYGVVITVHTTTTTTRPTTTTTTKTKNYYK